jgi:Tol biopolymer transport system component
VTLVAVLALVASGCAISRVSVSSGGTEGNDASLQVKDVTDEGRYTLFNSLASNLVANDTNGVADVFRRDEVSKQTIRVGVANDGGQLASGAEEAAMTPDGRYVAFVTEDELDAADTNPSSDVYVRDVVAGTTTLASQPPAGGLPEGRVTTVDISADGRFVAFMWYSEDTQNLGYLSELLRRDRQAGTTTVLSGFGHLDAFRMSRDAKHFTLREQCFRCFPIPTVLDTDGSAAGWPALGFTLCPFDEFVAVSPDGRSSVYASAGTTGIAQNCLPAGAYLVDRTTGAASALHLPGNGQPLALSRNARALLFAAPGDALPGGNASQTHLYLRDRTRGNDVRVDFTVAAQVPDANVISAALSDDGTQVAFVTAVANVVAGDQNGVEDVFVRKTGMPPSS